MARSGATLLMEKFLPPNLPATETAADYDAFGRVRLPAEFAEWFASAENTFRAVAVADAAEAKVRITFPLPGTTFFLDGDLPDLGRRVTLAAQGSAELQWTSPTLRVQRDGLRYVAWLEPGRHELSVVDHSARTVASTWVTVKEP